MRVARLAALLLLSSCARNPDANDENMRVRDTTMTSADTLGLNDTTPPSRRIVPDTAGDLDTTSRR